MARRTPTPTSFTRRLARRTSSRRFARLSALRPVALAALALLGGVHSAVQAGTTVTVSTRVTRLNAGGAVNISRVAPPDARAVPVTSVGLTGTDGHAQNVATNGNVVGAVSSSNGKSYLYLKQTTDTAIVPFNSFDLGSQAVMNVELKNENSSALYPIRNSATPARIYGALNSYYNDANGVAHTGGEIFLISQSGILFGAGAQINVGGLLASALDIDQSDYLQGLASIGAGKATFFGWTDAKGISTYAPQSNFVMVDKGANITTASGGRVYLLGGQVENAGNVQTPNGQTVLASGREIYLGNPGNGTTPLYMSEANDKVPTVKGLLVEVNGLMNDQEFATNSGNISVPTGNATIVGWAVNQRGRISATTSVSQNGSVYLLARSGTTPGTVVLGGKNVPTKYATVGGTLTMAQGSSDSGVFISPDQAKDANGAIVATNAGAVFTPSRVELSGKTIELKDGVQIVAPGATVNVRAAAAPAYNVLDLQEAGKLETNSGARVLLGANSVIDVAGTTNTTVSVARNFVTTELLGAQDLKDAPLQKDGPIYRSKLTFDIRGSSPILGDISSYRSAVQKTVDEFMAVGGSVVLASTGDVIAHPSARIDVSGGQVSYTEATVSPSVLLSATGQRYTLNTAPADVVYVGISGKESSTTDRFGTTKPVTVAPQLVSEAGYVDGQAGGKLTVLAPLAVMDAQLKASTVMGARQKAGLDPLAAKSSLTFGANRNSSDKKDSNGSYYRSMGSSEFLSAVMNDIRINAQVQAQPDSFWATSDDGSSAVDHRAGTTISRISAAQINAAGFGNLQFGAVNGIDLTSGADLLLPRQSVVDWRASGAAGITLSSKVRSEGGSFSAIASNPGTGPINYGRLTLSRGASIDMSGNWVNQFLDGKTVAGAVAGGNITLQSDHGLNLEDGSALNVSGGVTVSKSGAFSGTKAGSITLVGMKAESLAAKSLESGAPPPADIVHFGASLKGYGLSEGGSLSLKGWDVTVSGAASGLTQGVDAISTLVGSNFFTQNGFNSYSVDGGHSLTIKADALIQPHVDLWQGLISGRNAATGSNVADYVALDQRLLTVRKPVNLSFKSTGSGPDAGVLSMARGARIQADPLAAVTLSAARSLHMDGSIVAKGGRVDVNLAQKSIEKGILTLGEQALIDVSGGVLYTPNTNGLLLGTLYDGGSIHIGATNPTQKYINAEMTLSDGARLVADGGVGQLDVARLAGTVGPAYVRQTLASNGGSIDIAVGDGGAYLGSFMSAKGGNESASGGALSVSLSAGVLQDGHERVMHVQQDKLAGGALKHGEVTVSAQAIRDGGFANLYLASLNNIRFEGNVQLGLPGHLRLDAPILSASNKAVVTLSAGSTLQLGNGQTDFVGNRAEQVNAASLNAAGGIVELFGQLGTQDFSAISITSRDELRLRGLTPDGVASPVPVGALNTSADLNLNATQVVPTTLTNYTVNAQGHTVNIDGGDRNATTPLSGGASLTINATTINQNGVVKAPFGSITFNAQDSADQKASITLGANSLTSVSGEDLLVPFGATKGNGATWVYKEQNLVSMPDKAITLNAGDKSATVNTGAQLNLNGGGSLLAYEFVPGPGGSKDIFAGSVNGAFAIVPSISSYSPDDAHILASGKLTLNPGQGNTFGLGNTLTFGSGGPIAAGTYAILPARYALLPGAFLVKPNAGVSNVALGYSTSKVDGSYVVAAVSGVAGMSPNASTTASAYTVMSSEVARRYSEIKTTSLDDFQTAKATKAGTSLPALAKDAGRLSVIANSLQLDGQIQFAHAAGARGGQLDVAAAQIHVGSESGTANGVLNLSYEQLNKVGADSILLGGVRSQATDGSSTLVSVSSSQLTVDGVAGQALKSADLVLVAKDKVELSDGVQIASSGSSSSQNLSFQGDGALLRVSQDTSASSSRTDARGLTGQLVLGNNVSLTGGAVTAEGTQYTQINSKPGSSSSISADKLVVGAHRIELGGSSDQSTDQPLVVNDKLLAQLSQAKDLTLRSYSTIDVLGSTQLGGDKARNLTLDTGKLNVTQADAQLGLKAGAVNLLNTTGSVYTGEAGTGSLSVKATGANGGSGHVTIGPGQVALSGIQSSQIQAVGSVVMNGAGALSVPGDLTMQAQSLTAGLAAQQALNVQGAFTLGKPGTDSPAGTAASAGAGANLAISSRSFTQNGTLALPSGQLKILSDKAVTFGAGSVTDLSGLSKSLDGQGVATMGGSLSVTSSNDSIKLAQSGVLNVSAGLGASQAGSMSFSAVNGGVQLDGRLLAKSTSGQQGGALSIDARDTLNLKALAQRISDETAAGVSNFAQSIALRNRNGDQLLDKGTSFSANQLKLSLDAGDLTIKGALLANGASGGSISLSASGNVLVADGADIEAKALASGGKGGSISMNSVGGTISLAGGKLDASGQGGGDGSLNLRAARTATGVAIDTIDSEIQGVSAINVEAVRRYEVPSLSAQDIDAIYEDNSKYMGASVSSPYGTISQRQSAIITVLSKDQAALADRVHVRAGVELYAYESIDLTADVLGSAGWNLTRYDSSNQPTSLFGGEPFNLTIRTAGDLSVQVNLGDGFASVGVPGKALKNPGIAFYRDTPQAARTGNITLVAGADMLSSDPTMTVASADTGSVVIGSTALQDDGTPVPVSVRNTTGNIDIRAGRDVTLLNDRATVYTTGVAVSADDAAGYTALAVSNKNAAFEILQNWTALPFLYNGGSINIQAERDVAWLQDPSFSPQLMVDWWYRFLNAKASNQFSWWSRYDNFQQGVATFGGGDIHVAAGRDAWNVNAAAVDNGYSAADGVHKFGGGSVAVTAGRDVVGGVLAATQNLFVQAGRAVGLNAQENDLAQGHLPQFNLQLMYGSGQTQVEARNGLDIARVTTGGLLGAIKEYRSGQDANYNFNTVGALGEASLALQTTTGDLTYENLLPADNTNLYGTALSGSDLTTILPGTIAFTAATGSIFQLGELLQAPSAAGNIRMVAGQSVQVGTLTQFGLGAATHEDTLLNNVISTFYEGRELAQGLGHLGATDRTPVSLIAEEGDVTYNRLDLLKGVRLIAGRDVAVPEGNSGYVSLQHQSANELSLIKAGRDVSAVSTPNGFNIVLNGPGDLVVAAGRDVDLKSSQGYLASGSTGNVVLPKGSAHITVLAGVDFSQGDIADAAGAYYPLLGGKGVGADPATLYVQIKVQQAVDAMKQQLDRESVPRSDADRQAALSQAIVQATSQAKADLAAGDIYQLARAVAGDATFTSLLNGFINHRQEPGSNGALSTLDQQELAGQALAKVWAKTVDQNTRIATAITLAKAQSADRANALIAFVAKRTGQTLPIEQALKAFESLPVEQQTLYISKVLSDEVSAAIADAASKSGANRDEAYNKAYQALSTVFPYATPQSSSVDMGASQIKTMQNSTISVFNPNGGVNVGALTDESKATKSDAELGLVTANGGDMTVLVRDNVAVNTSRIFTLVKGNETIWSSLGNVDAGRGAKTVTSTPTPAFYIDSNGRLQIDATSAIAGSGIAATGLARIAAPKGEINAGDAGISATGGLDLAANFIRGADAIVSPVVNGAPPAPAVNLAMAAPTPTQPTAAGSADESGKDDADRKKKRRRNVLLDFLGFGTE